MHFITPPFLVRKRSLKRVNNQSYFNTEEVTMYNPEVS